MDHEQCDSRIHRRVIDTLYIDAMVLADEARSYFDEAGHADREALDPFARVTLSCELLKITTRLMHVIAWLLAQRAVDAGEIAPRDALDPARRLGPSPVSDDAVLAIMPATARALIASSLYLYRRVALLDEAQGLGAEAIESPVRSLQERLATVF